MKKVAIGCLIVLVLGGVAAAGVAYYAYRKVTQTAARFAELGNIAEIERDLRVRGGFVAPASEELTKVQVDKLLRVQTAIRQRLGARFTEFEQKYKVFSEKERPTSLSDVATMMSAYGDLVSAWMDAKRTQVAALNESELSLDEYRWIRDQAYRALGIPFVDLDIAKITEDFQQRATEQPGQLRGGLGPVGPESNRKLVEPFRKHFEECVALASFGL
jgi:hypothetical protein